MQVNCFEGSAPKDERDPRLRKMEREFGPKLRRLVGRFPVARELIALFRFWRDRRQPWSKRICAAGAILYFVSPFDLIPDWLPGGLADDAVVTMLAISHLAACIGPYMPRDLDPGNDQTIVEVEKVETESGVTVVPTE